ncbi:MAG: amidase [Betaproteobacteria bacterium]|jgi:aspartyl-tRNA(Asn)/glutamyl-tRNA(Gln) amidotransferase subunit A
MKMPSLAHLNHARQSRGWSSREALEASLSLAGESRAANVLLSTYQESARSAADDADRRNRLGAPQGLLSGALLTIKDLFDVEGQPTVAACPAFSDAPPASRHAPAVSRLREAGAVIVGKTNMTELAFTGVGINRHFGTPVNPFSRDEPLIPGGSSSGAAVSVALGLAMAALGSDTGGSIRVPAALCGLVGFKSTQARVPIAGALSLSHTLDTVCAMANSVEEVLLVDAVISSQQLNPKRRSVRGLRLAVPQNVVLEAIDRDVANAFQRTLSILSGLGAELIDVVWPDFAEIGQIQTPGGLPAAECWNSHRLWIEPRLSQVDPGIGVRLQMGAAVTSGEYSRMLSLRQQWIKSMELTVRPFDAWICPTVPTVAQPIAPLMKDESAFAACNRLILRNTFLVNFMNGCAVTIPIHAEGDLPVGLQIASVCNDDAKLLSIALAVERETQTHAVTKPRKA